MYGAILGDIIGSPYEFRNGRRSKDFPLFSSRSRFTDDTVMTIAVAEAIMGVNNEVPDGVISDDIIFVMHRWGQKYPDAGYGGRFSQWLRKGCHEPYNSYGNGSAMRVSSAGWLFDDLATTRRIAGLTAQVTHNHPEGIKGAEATAAAIYLARTGCSKDKIREYTENEFGYDLSRPCSQIRLGPRHDVSCQKTVPEAITAFLEGTDFEDAVRTAVSLGGDCDTLACIAGSIAEAYYSVPAALKAECRSHLPEDILGVLDDFEKCRKPRYLADQNPNA